MVTRDIRIWRASRLNKPGACMRQAGQPVLSINIARLGVLDHRARSKTQACVLACQGCGETHPACLDLYYPDAEWHAISIGALVQAGWTGQAIQSETDLGEVLCRNCHRKQQWAIQQDGDNTPGGA